MATMTSLIGLINKIQRACTVLGDHGGEGLSLWEALPSVAVVGGQVRNLFLLFIHLSIYLYEMKSIMLIVQIKTPFITFRVQVNPQYWKVSSEEIFFPVDLVFLTFFLFFRFELRFRSLQQC